MPSTFSQNLRVELIGSGEQVGVWGETTNANLGDLVEQAITGATNLNVTSGNITLTALNGIVDQARSAVLYITGTPGTTRTITIPNVSKTYTVKNRSDSTLDIKTASGSALSIPTLAEAYIYCDSNNGITGRIITDNANAFTSKTDPLEDVALTGTPTAPTAPAGTNDTQIATTAFVNSALPVGSVIMWYGSSGAVPTGWQICDGTNGTPDLRNKFVVGAGDTYALDDTGGVDEVTLDSTQIPNHIHSVTSKTTEDADVSHTHGFSGSVSGNTGNQSNNHSHGFSGTTSTIGNHAHSYTYQVQRNGDYFGSAGQSEHTNTSGTTSGAGAHSHSFSGTTGGISANHNHSFSGSFSGTTGGMSANATHSHTLNFNTDATGGGLAHENRPPYVALFYIMRV